MRIVNPAPSPTRAGIDTAPRLASLDGARLGFLSNGKPNADLVLAGIRSRLERRYNCVGSVSADKAVDARGSGDPAPDWMLDGLAAGVAGVINAAGD
jgi:hypothetical protein